ncbi:MAG: phosphate acyltransferase PlsX [Clostridia bacterium]|nr:phosphate acyltransferase PlsX [Clostridia bacterium]
MRIAIDAFGGDNAPLEIIKGAALAEKEYGVHIVLCGDENIIKKCIADNNIIFNELDIVNATDVISMHDDPTSLLKAHKDSSMAVAFRELAEGRADAFVSAGSTGAVVVGGTFIVKRIKGIKRPALAAMLPSPDSYYMMMDIGANAECRPEMLHQFGVMASAYLKKVEKIDNPTIGLLNIGTEDTKGTELQKEAYKLLQDSDLNFIGNIESRELPNGVCDAVITDGYTGNIALKLIEGTAITLFSMLVLVFKKNFSTKMCYLILKGRLRGVKNKMNASEVGGAPLLGTKKPVFKAHGNSNAYAFKNAIGKAKLFAENDVIGTIENSFNEEEK